METAKSAVRLPIVAVAATALVAAGLAPVAASPEISTRAVAAVSAEVALAASAVVDSFDTLAGLAPFDMSSIAEELNVPGTADVFDVLPGAADALDVPGAAAAFDIVGLFNAEVAAAVGLFNRFISLPFTLYDDISNVVTSLINLDFGMAFSQAATIPLDIVNYVLGLPGAVVNTAFNMIFVLPGEYLFNFG
ncbi:hypothetical protein ABW16_02770 [Mycolicibacter heraklionensis]|uniref:PE domain-containing protein n=1 Tax=Mycolicibacter heraklionensis TaxID=512402 RepID=A0ABR5FLA8_9MYCO|nr:hypothetical protein [Mycolicibacter heraklionensis]KLO31750.1 hypothetical protein ABW16_02770 [Mycolicibacter heraklionensis]